MIAGDEEKEHFHEHENEKGLYPGIESPIVSPKPKAVLDNSNRKAYDYNASPSARPPPYNPSAAAAAPSNRIVRMRTTRKAYEYKPSASASDPAPSKHIVRT